MKIGTVVDPQSLGELTKAITTIMQQNSDQETIRHAISQLGEMARIENVTIQHCVIKGDRTVEVNVDADDAEARVHHRSGGGPIRTDVD